jgi:hypothetical protein
MHPRDGIVDPSCAFFSAITLALMCRGQGIEPSDSSVYDGMLAEITRLPAFLVDPYVSSKLKQHAYTDQCR